MHTTIGTTTGTTSGTTSGTMIKGSDIEALGAKLDTAGILEAHELDLLVSVFVLAGQAAADHGAEVSGFAFDAFHPQAADGSVKINHGLLLPAVRPGSLAAGFNLGLKGVGDPTGLPAVQ